MTTTTDWETVRHDGKTYKVLNDHAGNLTATEWRWQPGDCAEHMCSRTGLELLGGIAPPCTPGRLIDKTTPARTIGELFKSSTKKFCNSWLGGGANGQAALATAGFIRHDLVKGKR